MNKEPQNKFLITDSKHPHSGCSGSLQLGEVGVIVKTILGKEMMTLNMQNCPHGIRSCMVRKDQITHISK